MYNSLLCHGHHDCWRTGYRLMEPSTWVEECEADASMKECAEGVLSMVLEESAGTKPTFDGEVADEVMLRDVSTSRFIGRSEESFTKYFGVKPSEFGEKTARSQGCSGRRATFVYRGAP